MKRKNGANRAGRRAMPLLIIVALVACILTVPAFAADDVQYSDARWANGKYASDFGDMAARRLYVYGLIENSAEPQEDGTDADCDFRAGEQATRLDAAMLLYRICGQATEQQHPFTDVPEEYNDAMNWLYASGITKGIGGGLYGIGTITQGQFFVMISRLLMWGTEKVDEAMSVAAREQLIPRDLDDSCFSNGEMYLAACLLINHSFPERRTVQQPRMSCPETMRITVDSYEDAVTQTKEATLFLPGRIEVFFSDKCSEDDRQLFFQHYDWQNGDKQLPIIGMTDRMSVVPYYMVQRSEGSCQLRFNSFAQGFVAFVSGSDWLRVYKDEAYSDLLQRFYRERIEPLKKTATEYERASKAHDLLCALASYDYEEYYAIVYGSGERHVESHDILGYFLRQKIVCDGYANMYQWFLFSLGIESYVVNGRADTNGHAWNKVRIDGTWYNVDVCWDDTGSNMRRFFLRSDEWFSAHRHSFTDSYSATAFASPKNYQ